MSECPCADDCLFADGEWKPDLLTDAGRNPPDLPLNWRSLITLAVPPQRRQAYECRYLVELKVERPARKTAICQQAEGTVYSATETIQAIVGPLVFGTKPATWTALRLLYDNLDRPIYYFKRVFSRGRPFMCCEDVEPMYPKGAPFYPAHPAYPSGHSTQAHALAYFYARLFPQLTDKLLAAAADIALNREVAGLHYPSDSLAGKLLAGQVVDLLLQAANFKAAAIAAAADWPGARTDLL
ncbi:phosphatase PAP2 family protein [Pelomonas sp. Root1237]|uniref:phosphatase PAP2 family protein n=1 Tax=Pelomonas sp. Root1237 TaxID=1736434 RepID=UPI0009EA83F5|nr:phosphatase PAP2 family protein [Pelomonas sp. Root1237]